MDSVRAKIFRMTLRESLPIDNSGLWVFFSNLIHKEVVRISPRAGNSSVNNNNLRLIFYFFKYRADLLSCQPIIIS